VHHSKSARLRVAINYYQGGSLLLEASTNASDWQSITRLFGTNRTTTASLPVSLFPASAIYVRLSHPGAEGHFQVNAYEYEAPWLNPFQMRKAALISLMCRSKYE